MPDLLGRPCAVCGIAFDMHDLSAEMMHHVPRDTYRCPDCRAYMHREACRERHACPRRQRREQEKLAAWTAAAAEQGRRR